MRAAQQDLVSVCIPVYNGEAFLQEAILSVLNQTYTHLEILFVDDGSEDRSLEIIRSFAKKDARIKWFENSQNIGLVPNWNQCLQKASGQWIKFHFQDDLMEHYAIERMVELAQETRHRLVLCDRTYFGKDQMIHDTNQRLKSLVHNTQKIVSKQEVVSLFNKNQMGYNFLGEPIVGLISSSLIKKYGGFDERMRQMVDMEYWLRIGSHEGFAFLNQPLVKFRVHNQSQTFRNTRRSTELSAGILDRFYLVSKLFEHDGYSDYRHLSAQTQPLKRLKKIFYSKCVTKAGYFRSYGLLPKEDRKTLSWSVIFMALMKDIEIYLGRIFSSKQKI